MTKYSVKWIKNHTQICDHLDVCMQLMQGYLDRKSEDFNGIAAKRFLLGRARDQVAWYRQSSEALDFVGCVACRLALESGQPFLEHYLPVYNFSEIERVDFQVTSSFVKLC